MRRPLMGLRSVITRRLTEVEGARRISKNISLQLAAASRRTSAAIKRATLLPMPILFLVAAMPASAQDAYPSRPIKVLVPFAPGGAVDIVARIVSEHMRQTLGQNLVIENKPGAVGVLAIEQMVRAKHDGYTLMFGNNNSNVITNGNRSRRCLSEPADSRAPVSESRPRV
jgi:tripartite-type tricarboxylate transporter receptor subunit TctC